MKMGVVGVNRTKRATEGRRDKDKRRLVRGRLDRGRRMKVD